MIGITKLLSGKANPDHILRYGKDTQTLPSHLLQFSQDKKPVVVWNCTRRCNLNCIHCYSDSKDRAYPGELTTEEAKKFISDLAAFKVPVLLFSGGEPLLREDIFDLVKFAVSLGIRAVISTNGVLISSEIAKRIKKSGVSYVGVSLDGVGEVNDQFRGKKGAFESALYGIRNCLEIDQKIGLRFTINRRNFFQIPAIFDLVEREKIPRVCFYHLVYAGRGSKLIQDDLDHQTTRQVVDYIIARSKDFISRQLDIDVLTVDNHADGVYLFLHILKENPSRAKEVYRLLKWNGGNNSGIAIACVDNLGEVHADQFWTHYSFGNVKNRLFSQIWLDTSDPLMAGLKDRKSLLKGRCSQCNFLDICNGNFRVRAEAVYGDVWAEDPACYLTDEEIAIKPDLL